MSSFLLALGVGASVYGAAMSGIQERQSNWTVGQEVQTSSGLVTGHAAKNQSEVSEYLGIPYGQPPIGDLRFAAPVKFEGNASINGTSYVGVLFGHYEKVLLTDLCRAPHVPSSPSIPLYPQLPSCKLQISQALELRYCRY